MLPVCEVVGQPPILKGNSGIDKGGGSTVVVHKEWLEKRKDHKNETMKTYLKNDDFHIGSHTVMYSKLKVESPVSVRFVCPFIGVGLCTIYRQTIYYVHINGAIIIISLILEL